MKQNTVLVMSLLAVTLSVVTVSVMDSQTAEAAKASGTYTQKYGEATKHKVCGDQLCQNESSAKSYTVSISEFKSLMDRMDQVHEKHQSEMIKKWKSSSSHQQIEMYHMMNKMVEKMEFMDMSKYMKMMQDGMHDQSHDKKSTSKKTSLYNKTLNPNQIEYPNILGFNDLHIHAIRHLDLDKSHGTNVHLLDTIVHHHCKVYDDMTAACLLFPYGMTDQDKPYGIEYVIPSDQYDILPEEEKQYWHYHKTEFPRAQATFPDLSDDQLSEIQPMLDETYGKVYYFWNYGDSFPLGEPHVLVVQDLPEQ